MPPESETSSPKPSRRLLANPLANRSSRVDRVSVCAGHIGGQGRGRTADLPLSRRIADIKGQQGEAASRYEEPNPDKRHGRGVTTHQLSQPGAAGSQRVIVARQAVMQPRVTDLSMTLTRITWTRSTTLLAIWQVSAEFVGVARDHAPWMTVQMQRGRSPLVPKPGIVMLKRVAGMIGGKGNVPGVNVVSVTIGRRIVIHQTNIVRADSSGQCSERRQCAECGQHR